MNFINSDPDHIEVLESKTTSTEVYSFNNGKNKNCYIIVA